jgi:hypothetical protein
VRTRRMTAIAAFGMIAVLAVAGCGSGDEGAAGASQQQRGAEAGNATDFSGGAGGAPAEKPASAEKPAATPADQSAAGGQQPVPASQRKVVRTAQLSVEVDDVFAAARTVYEVGARYGGFVADEKTEDDSAQVQLKVAADRLDDALAALSAVGTVKGRTQQAQDVTEQVADVQARVASQRASVERVRALLDHATAISEIVQIESELTRRQADLESLEQRAAALAGQTELATVSVQLHKPGGAAGRSDEDTGFLTGLTSGWRVFVASTEVLLTVLGALLPFLVALAVPTVLIVWLLRRRRPVAAAPPTVAAAAPAART